MKPTHAIDAKTSIANDNGGRGWNLEVAAAAAAGGISMISLFFQKP
jgi:hypothetical protein